LALSFSQELRNFTNSTVHLALNYTLATTNRIHEGTQYLNGLKMSFELKINKPLLKTF